VMDLSVGGAFVACKESIAKGIKFLLLVEDPQSGKEIVLEAKVMHQGWYLSGFENYQGCGVRFENLTAAALSVIRDLMARVGNEPPRKWTLEH